MRARVVGVRGTVLLLACVALAGSARNPRSVPPDEDQFLNAALPDIQLTTAAGTQIALSSLTEGQPLLFTLVFTRCAGVCSPFLASWRAADRSRQLRSFHRLVLSFDHRDTITAMAALAHHLGVATNPDWTFAIAAPDDIRRLADATGFWYDWDESRQQFDHPAMLAAVRHGRLIRLLVGGVISSGRLDELMRDASGEFVPSYPLPGRARFRCVQYDARTGRVLLDWGFALLLVPVGSVGLTTAIMFAAGARVRPGPVTSSRQLLHDGDGC
jgi:cytochrome oxidase Cu insertion factor (SCO1/SenC/PrrC family)